MNSEDMNETAFGHIICHCSEDDGVPDVGVTLGLGDGKCLWIGELLTRDGANCGAVLHHNGDRAVVPFPDGTDWQMLAELVRDHVAPAMRRTVA